MTQRKKLRWGWREGWLFVRTLLIFVLLFSVLHGRTWWQQRQERLNREAQAARVAQKGADEAERFRRNAQDRLDDATRVSKVLWSPDGQTLVSLNQHTIWVWDASTGKKVQVLPRGQWLNIAFSPNGQRLAAVGWRSQTHALDRRIRQVQLTTSPKLFTSHHATEWFTQLWEVGRTGFHLTRQFAVQNLGLPQQLLFSHDGSRLLVCGGEKYDSPRIGACGIVVYDSENGKETQHLTAPIQTYIFNGARFDNVGVSAIALSPDDQTLVMGDYLPGVSFWRFSDGKYLGSMKGAFSGNPDQILAMKMVSETVSSLEFSPDGKTLAMGGFGSNALLDVSRRKLVGGNSFWTDPGQRIHYAPDGQSLMIFGGNDYGSRPLIVLPLSSTPTYFQGNFRKDTTDRGDVNDARFSPDGARIASTHDNGVIKIWDVKTGKVLMTLHHSL